jgi:hypothetical protein
MPDAKNLRAMGATGQATMLSFCKWHFFYRYLAQIANNGGVWAEP